MYIYIYIYLQPFCICKPNFDTCTHLREKHHMYFQILSIIIFLSNRPLYNRMYFSVPCVVHMVYTLSKERNFVRLLSAVSDGIKVIDGDNACCGLHMESAWPVGKTRATAISQECDGLPRRPTIDYITSLGR